MINHFSLMLFVFLTVLFYGPSALAQRGSGFGEYQIILDQQLLGRPAPEEPRQQQVAPPTAPPPAWTTEYRLTMITEDLFSGLARVGLYHVRNQVGYLLIEGEEYDHGFTLLSVNYDLNQAEIRYQGVRHRFSLESAPVSAAEPQAQPRSAQTRQSQPRTVRRVNPSAPEPEPPSEPPSEPPEPRFSSPEELQAHLQEVQMDAIRTGKPPLPIPLTPEMDAQLVQEGVLPPLEE